MEKISDVIKDMKLSDRIQKNLEKSYMEAKGDPVFSTIVDHLHMDDRKLVSSTSRIEDCAKEYRHCQKCKGLAYCKNQITGYVYFPENVEGNLEFNYIACKYQKKYRKETKFLDNVSLFSIPREIQNARMKDIYTDDENRFEAIEAIETFIHTYRKSHKGKGLYLSGSFGCGKTYLVSAMLNELAKDGVKSAIVFWPEFLQQLKSSFGGSYQEIIDKIKKAPLLFIDDIGAEVVTLWARDEVLGPILQYRMQEDLPTFFTSNLSIVDLEEHLSITSKNVDTLKARRIIERIKYLTKEVQLISKNLR